MSTSRSDSRSSREQAPPRRSERVASHIKRFASPLDYAESGYTSGAELFAQVPDLKNMVGKRVLDLGCGDGGKTTFLAKQGLDIVGVDNCQYNPRALDIAREFAALKQVKITFLKQHAERLDFSDESFDAVLMIDVLEHLPDPARVLDEASRVLRKGGRIYIIWGPLYYGPHGHHFGDFSKFPWIHLTPGLDLLRYLEAKAAKRGLNFIRRELAAGVFSSLNRLTIRKFRRIMMDAGLEVHVFRKNKFPVNRTYIGIMTSLKMRSLSPLLDGLGDKLRDLALAGIYRMCNLVSELPLLQEFTTPSVYVELQKKDSSVNKIDTVLGG